MTVGDLEDALKIGEYPASMHVVGAITDGPKARVEIIGLWVDNYGVLNLIMGRHCDEIDPELMKENGLR